MASRVGGSRGGHGQSPKELFDYALCHARTDDYLTAAVVYQRLIDQHPDHKLCRLR